MKGSVKDVAQLLLLTKSRVYALVRLGVIPKPQAGGFGMEACVQGYIRYLRKPSGAVDQDIRCKKLKADLLEMRVRERAGLLVEKRKVDHAAWTMYRATRDAFLNVGSRIGGLVAAEQDAAACGRIVDKEITTVLWDLCGETERVSGKEEDAAHDDEPLDAPGNGHRVPPRSAARRAGRLRASGERAAQR